jgi:hypothetical protein
MTGQINLGGMGSAAGFYQRQPHDKSKILELQQKHKELRRIRRE